MKIFSLADYRYPSMQDLARLQAIESENYLLPVVQRFFDEHKPIEPISIGQERDNCVCLERDGVLIAIYFSERGGKNLIGLFKSIYHAFDFLALKYLGIPKLPLNWVALNQEFDKQQATQ
jgi:hypothetical protein